MKYTRIKNTIYASLITSLPLGIITEEMPKFIRKWASSYRKYLEWNIQFLNFDHTIINLQSFHLKIFEIHPHKCIKRSTE